MFKKVLIANRGEIAVRIAQTLQEMGIVAVAVHSDVDRQAVHVAAADEAYALGGTTSAESYLRIDKIIDVARRHGVEAIHPGYGFLSENEDFAAACRDTGITFIGPTPEVIRDMGDKIVAKRTFSAAGVPTVPGFTLGEGFRAAAQGAQSRGGEESGDRADGDGVATLEELRRRCGEIGYPVLIKAAAGGGGKGMRVVKGEGELVGAIEAAQREAGSAFGDARVFVEKYITRPRHVEIQIFGDTHGNVVHLFERECSIQRRHQKIVEESPSTALTPERRAAMGEAAVRAAKAIGYVNAGTVEFIVDEGGAFYFLEVNTRLQVEHPVTELVTRQDLVRAQVMVAAGERLPFSQDSVSQLGHSIECRVYAEDATRGFLPSTGRIEHYVAPAGPGVRVDSGVQAGSEVTVHYDPMLAKLAVWGRTRDEAIDKMAWALSRFVMLGVTTNIEFLHAVVTHPGHRAGRIHTHFLEEHAISTEVSDVPALVYAAAAMAGRGLAQPAPVAQQGPWQSGNGWRAY